MNEAAPHGELDGPASPAALYFAFNRLALQAFGGAIAVAQTELVERRRWLTNDEFVAMLSMSQVLPGPNIVNLSLMFGDRCFGLRGAFAALSGLLLVPLVIVLALAALYSQFAQSPQISAALRGIGLVAAGLVIATALKVFGALKSNPMGLPLCLLFAALTLGAVAVLHWPLVAVIGALGPLAVAVAWRSLKQ